MNAVTPSPPSLAFGDFALDPGRRQVVGPDGSPVPLTPRLFNALEVFTARPGELIDKDTLMQALWPDRVVEENSLSQVIHNLRRALGDDGEQRRYIQTEARRGFRFVVPVKRLESSTASATGPADMSAAHGAPRSTLAVLPFVSLTAQPELGLLEVGMADSLISRLSTVPGLVLRSIGSVRRFADPSRDPVEAARSLGVAWILDGTLQQAGDQLRVNARLLSIPAGVAAWSGSFNAAFTNVFDLQDVISGQVAQSLAAPLGGQAPWAPALAAARLGGTRDIGAYQLYLAAQQQAQGIRADGLARSVELYRQALTADPAYALAHVGIAESSRRMVFGADRPTSEALDAPRAHVIQALSMSPDLAEAHTQLGWIHYWYDFDWRGAEQAFRLALALNSNVALAHFGLGHLLLVTMGRIDEGFAHLRVACELDPMSLLYQTLQAGFMADGGDTIAAQSRLDRVLQIEPRFWIAYTAIGAMALKRADHTTAIDALRRAEAFSDGSTQATAMLGVALARGGQPAEARGLLVRLQALAQARHVPPTALASVHAALGDAGEALDALELAFDVRDARLTMMRGDHRWRDLRGEPRFAALLERMNLHRCGPCLAL